MIDKILCDGEEIELWTEDGPLKIDARDEPFEKKRGARLPKNQIVIHESVTHDADPVEREEGDRDDTTERVLRRRGLGVHFMVGVGPNREGVIVQHNDLTDKLSHAGPLNSASVAIEVINPYYGARLKDSDPWKLTIPARWAHKKLYVVPTPEQLECTWRLVSALTNCCFPGLEIPRSFVGLNDTESKLSMGRKRISTNTPGVWAHHYDAHADGAFPVLYCVLRELGLPPSDAFIEATRIGREAVGGFALIPTV